MASDTRARMVQSTIGLLQQRGLAATSFTEVLAASGASRGTIYHHFPGGKQQLAAEAAAANATDVRGYLAGLSADSPRALVENFIASVRPVMEGSARGGGCAVAAITVGGGSDGHDDAELRRVAAAAFDAWSDELTTKLISAGLDAEQAEDLAQLMMTTLEGAHVLCRAAGTIAPYDSAARALVNATPIAHARVDVARRKRR